MSRRSKAQGLSSQGRGSRSMASLRGTPGVLAFTLIEILVAVALLSFIVLGLLAMFNQVQRAFRSSMTQVDVLESGRAVADMLARDLEQVYPTRLPNLNLGAFSTNFLAVVNTKFSNPLVQSLPGTSDVNGTGQGPYRTNIIQTLFFVTRENQNWNAIGYFVYPDSVSGVPVADGGGVGVGTLYRYSVNTNCTRDVAVQLGAGFSQELNNIFANGPTNLPPTVSLIADGVIDLTVRTYDTNGIAMVPWLTGGDSHLAFPKDVFHNLVVMTNAFGYYVINDQMNYSYISNAVPAAVDFEIGFLEQHILDRFKAIGSENPAAQRAYLMDHASEVHLFRQRIPIRNLDFQAYQ